MLRDPDLEKMAVQSQHKLTQEFAEKHANLRERVRRVSVDAAREIAEEMNCPLQVAEVAYLLDMDGITTRRKAVRLLTAELHRRESIGDGVPNLPGNVQEFAVDEGRWIHYIYGSFTREFELKVRELSNLEAVLDEDEPPVEKAISLMNARIKMAEAFLLPVVQTWFKDHIKGTSDDLLVFLGPAVTGWQENTLRGKLRRMKKRNQALFRKLTHIISMASDSMTMDLYTKRVDTIVQELDVDIQDLTERAVAHLILHMAPRPTGARGDRSRFVEVGMASTRGNKTEPDMASPFDFLERDIRLARRRKGIDRDEYIQERIARVLRVLKYQGNDVFSSIEQCVIEINERFKLNIASVGDEVTILKQEFSNSSPDDYDAFAVTIIHQFIDNQVLAE
ncbi:MAG: hypothetical protein P1Q69_18490 [Candidatus Thorarchaeota archaeon]|nr:hypothetical protein [Candidatus Thorarchaeota archaeon]